MRRSRVEALYSMVQDLAFYRGIPFARQRNSNLLGSVGRLLFAVLPRELKNSNSFRKFVDALQPTPSRPANRFLAARRRGVLPQIEILIAAAEKDFDIINCTIEAAILSSLNPVSLVKVVVPRASVAVASESLSPIAEVHSEDDFLPIDLLNAASRFQPIGRAGWVAQQLIGLYGAWSSDSRGVLVLDSDTLLAGTRVWLTNSGIQPLSFSYEYHQPYESHASRVWGKRHRHHFLSYITHYMMMQPDILKKMFPRLEDIVRWVELADPGEPSGLADYHSYGRWISDNRRNRIRFERWSNITSDYGRLDGTPEERVLFLQHEFPEALSFSSHSWARKPNEE